MGLQQSTTLRNAQLDAITTAVGSAGLLKIYTGTQPADVATSASGTLLSTHTLGSPFASGASSGALAPTLPSNVNAAASGTAGYYRVTTSGGTAVYQDGVVSSGNGLVLNPANNVITSGQPVQVNSWSITAGGA